MRKFKFKSEYLYLLASVLNTIFSCVNSIEGESVLAYLQIIIAILFLREYKDSCNNLSTTIKGSDIELVLNRKRESQYFCFFVSIALAPQKGAFLFSYICPMEINYTHLAELYGFRCWYNDDTGEIKGTNFFNDKMIDLFIWIDITFEINDCFCVKIIKEL